MVNLSPVLPSLIINWALIADPGIVPLLSDPCRDVCVEGGRESE